MKKGGKKMETEIKRRKISFALLLIGFVLLLFSALYSNKTFSIPSFGFAMGTLLMGFGAGMNAEV